MQGKANWRNRNEIENKDKCKNTENKNQKWMKEIETKQNKIQKMPKIVRNQPHKWDWIAKMI